MDKPLRIIMRFCPILNLQGIGPPSVITHDLDTSAALAATTALSAELYFIVPAPNVTPEVPAALRRISRRP